MNNKKNKTSQIIFITFLVIGISALTLFIFNLLKDNEKTNPNKKENLSYREEALRKFLDQPSLYPSTIINKRTFRLIGYDEGGGSVGARPNPPLGFGGAIVFEEKGDGKLDLFWETSEAISHGRAAVFQDVTNDGIDEIVISGDQGVTGRNISFYIYAWRNDNFELITPAEVTTSTKGEFITTLVGGDSSRTFMKDLDGDNIYEIIVGWRDSMYDFDELKGANDERQFLKREKQRIYKYNGNKYILWEEKVIKENINIREFPY